ncbi:MAG: ribosome assembly cofactor RimP [Chitinophagales bacterium]|nr:ribosome assembly cofactor RimP [Chitinophagales bacterium]
MDIETLKSRIGEWLNPLLEERNFFLVDVKVSMGKKIEVYVDSDEGIHIDDCAVVSRFLERHLDGSGLVPDNYILEVSSPGMSNPLRVPRQYKKRIGRKLEVIKTNGEKIEAQLTEADDEKIKLVETIQEKKNKKNKEAAPEPKQYEVKYADIKRATLVFSF